jgi:hypothetical protein
VGRQKISDVDKKCPKNVPLENVSKNTPHGVLYAKASALSKLKIGVPLALPVSILYYVR